MKWINFLDDEKPKTDDWVIVKDSGLNSVSQAYFINGEWKIRAGLERILKLTEKYLEELFWLKEYEDE